MVVGPDIRPLIFTVGIGLSSVFAVLKLDGYALQESDETLAELGPVGWWVVATPLLSSFALVLFMAYVVTLRLVAGGLPGQAQNNCALNTCALAPFLLSALLMIGWVLNKPGISAAGTMYPLMFPAALIGIALTFTGKRITYPGYFGQ